MCLEATEKLGCLSSYWNNFLIRPKLPNTSKSKIGMLLYHSSTIISVLSHQVKEVHLRESSDFSILWDGFTGKEYESKKALAFCMEVGFLQESYIWISIFCGWNK